MTRPGRTRLATTIATASTANLGAAVEKLASLSNTHVITKRAIMEILESTLNRMNSHGPGWASRQDLSAPKGTPRGRLPAGRLTEPAAAHGAVFQLRWRLGGFQVGARPPREQGVGRISYEPLDELQCKAPKLTTRRPEGRRAFRRTRASQSILTACPQISAHNHSHCRER